MVSVGRVEETVASQVATNRPVANLEELTGCNLRYHNMELVLVDLWWKQCQ
jgi:hypothetical protein